MSEDILLLIFGLLFGTPILLACAIYLKYMSEHNKDLNKRLDEINKIKERREERKYQQRQL